MDTPVKEETKTQTKKFVPHVHDYRNLNHDGDQRFKVSLYTKDAYSYLTVALEKLRNVLSRVGFDNQIIKTSLTIEDSNPHHAILTFVFYDLTLPFISRNNSNDTRTINRKARVNFIKNNLEAFYNIFVECLESLGPLESLIFVPDNMELACEALGKHFPEYTFHPVQRKESIGRTDPGYGT